MRLTKRIFDVMIAIGLVFVMGRVIGLLVDFPLLAFFHTYTLESFLVLAVGLIGSEVMKRKLEGTP